MFVPTGVAWEQVGPSEWTARLPAGKGYLSAAALPDAKAETLALFTRHAYAFIQDTRVSWQYQPERSQVESTFTVSTRAMEGPDNGPLLGLYPHQWFNNASVQPQLGGAYDTVRGPIRLLAAAQFKIQRAYNGFVPYWPGLKDAPRLGELTEVIDKDLREARRMMLQEGDDAYWQGKGLQRTLMLLDVVEQQGDFKARDKLLEMMKKRVEEWFSGESRKTYFAYDKSLRMGTSLEDRPRYTPTTCFETFPFPEGLTPNIPAAQYEHDPRAERIADAARKLNEARERWLNPPEWTERVPEVVPGYPDRIIAKPGHDAELKKRTLTNLYNARPEWLALLHREDEARLSRGAELFDELLTYFAKKRD